MATSERKLAASLAQTGNGTRGGKFINTVPENAKRHGSTPVKPARKQEIAPYVWEFPPASGQMSIFRQLAGIEIFNRAAMTFTFNPDLRLSYATPEAVERRQTLIAKFNAGERWI